MCVGFYLDRKVMIFADPKLNLYIQTVEFKSRNLTRRYESTNGTIEGISHDNEEMLFNVISFIDKRDEARVLSSKEEIVRRATCKFVRNFHPPPALVPSRREKRDTGTGCGGGRVKWTRPSKKTKS